MKYFPNKLSFTIYNRFYFSTQDFPYYKILNQNHKQLYYRLLQDLSVISTRHHNKTPYFE